MLVRSLQHTNIKDTAINIKGAASNIEDAATNSKAMPHTKVTLYLRMILPGKLNVHRVRQPVTLW